MRFFFHVIGNGKSVRDDEGELLASAEEAQAHAAEIAYDLRHDDFKGCQIHVTDETGQEIARVPMGLGER